MPLFAASYPKNQSLDAFLDTQAYLVTAVSHKLFARLIIRHDDDLYGHDRDEIITLGFTTEEKAQAFRKIACDRMLVAPITAKILPVTLREFSRWEKEGQIKTSQLALDVDLNNNPDYLLAFR